MIRKFGRKNSAASSNQKVLRVESLECRRLLAGDGIVLGDEPFPDFGSVQGFKWEDTNGNGSFDRGEVGLPGVTIFADTDGNGIYDPGEPITETNDDGSYILDEIPVGEHVIYEIVPDGFRQTYPATFIPGNADGDEFSTTFPEFISLHLEPGQSHVEAVGIQVHPFCIRPFELDVVASNPDIEVLNHSGIQLNGCGGDETRFEVEFIGDGRRASL